MEYREEPFLDDREYILFSIPLLFIFSAFFSGSEAALFSITPLDLHEIRKQGGGVRRLIWTHLRKPRDLLIVILTGNLFVNILISTLTNHLTLAYWRYYGPVITIAVITPLVIFFSEIIPKTISVHHYRYISLWTILPIHIFSMAIWPLRTALRWIVNGIMRGFHVREPSEPNHYSKKELRSSIALSQKEGAIERDAGRYLINFFRLEDREAQHIMIPRNETVFIAKKASMEEAIEIFRAKRLTSIPVYEKDHDNIIGFLYLRDIIPHMFGIRKARHIVRMIRKAHFFPYKKDLFELLKEFRSNRIDIAVLIDEFGGTAGIVTMKRMIAYLMGYDDAVDPDKKVHKTSRNSYRIEADMLLEDFNEMFGTTLESAYSETLGGFLLEHLEHIPENGEYIAIADHRFIVLKTEEQKILQILYRHF